MSGLASLAAFDIAQAAEIRTVGIDDLSTVRYIHSSAFRMLASAHVSEREIEAFTDHVYSPAYTDALVDAQRNGQLYGAWLGSELIGTAGWSPADDAGVLARVRSVYVRPLFSGLGLGSRLVQATEDHARHAGFDAYVIRAGIHTVPFFSQLGYQITSHGVQALGGKVSLPVAFMRKAGAAIALRPPLPGHLH
jgi:GNAT superfamily N-acetyltransferase